MASQEFLTAEAVKSAASLFNTLVQQSTQMSVNTVTLQKILATAIADTQATTEQAAQVISDVQASAALIERAVGIGRVADETALMGKSAGNYELIATNERVAWNGTVVTARGPILATIQQVQARSLVHTDLQTMLASTATDIYQTAGGTQGQGHLFSLLDINDQIVADGLYVVQRRDGRKLRRNFNGAASLAWATGIDVTGQSDSRSTLQAILDASVGKSLTIPMGVSLAISECLIGPANLTLRMDGVLTYTGSSTTGLDAMLLVASGTQIDGDGWWERADTARHRIYAFKVFEAQNVTIRNPRCRNGMAVMQTTAAGGAGDYVNVTEAKMCRNIMLVNPRADGQHKDKTADSGSFALDQQDNGIAAISIEYTADWSIQGGYIRGFLHGLQFWGGDANPVTGQGNWVNTRKCTDGMVADLIVRDVRAGGIWGGMGERIFVRDCNVQDCGDVCADFEGSRDSAFMGGYYANGRNGTLAVFYENQNVSFGSGLKAVSTTGAPLFRTHGPDDNAYRPTNSRIRLDVHGEGRGVITTIDNHGVGPTYSLSIGGKYNNVRIHMDHAGQDSVTLEDGLELGFDMSPNVATDAIYLCNVRSLMRIGRVRVSTAVAWPAGSRACNLWWFDGTRDGELDINGLTTRGFPLDLKIRQSGGNGNYALSGAIRNASLENGRYERIEDGPKKGFWLLAGCTRANGKYYPAFGDDTYYNSGQEQRFADPQVGGNYGRMATSSGANPDWGMLKLS